MTAAEIAGLCETHGLAASAIVAHLGLSTQADS